MRKSLVLVMFIAGMVFSSVGYAEESAPGSVAVGVHGIGTEWNEGRPTVRWRASDKWAFDFTPVLSVEDLNTSSDNSSSLGANDSRARVYGLNVGVVRQIRNAGGLSIGWRAEAGYVYTYVEANSLQMNAFWPGYGSDLTVGRRQAIDLGFGPDLEYFVPGVPGLSLGASAQIHYRYTSDHYHSTYSSTYPGLTYYSPPYQDAYHDNSLALIGELLTVRYYY